jgi:hypothetical protein
MLTAAVTEVVDHPCIKHSWASTTAGYTSVGTDHKRRMLRAALDRAFGSERGEHR